MNKRRIAPSAVVWLLVGGIYFLLPSEENMRVRTREQLYQEARSLGVEGRSHMNKAQLQRAVDNKKR